MQDGHPQAPLANPWGTSCSWRWKGGTWEGWKGTTYPLDWLSKPLDLEMKHGVFPSPCQITRGFLVRSLDDHRFYWWNMVNPCGLVLKDAVRRQKIGLPQRRGALMKAWDNLGQFVHFSTIDWDTLRHFEVHSCSTVRQLQTWSQPCDLADDRRRVVDYQQSHLPKLMSSLKLRTRAFYQAGIWDTVRQSYGLWVPLALCCSFEFGDGMRERWVGKDLQRNRNRREKGVQLRHVRYICFL